MNCSVVNCNRPRWGHGLCVMHYTRMRRHNTTDEPQPIRPGRPRRPAEERFWQMVDKQSEKGCWLWKIPTKQRYINFCYDGRWGPSVSAHRWAYEHLVSPIPKGMQIDHLCRNTHCVNPAHMEVVTPRVNVLRGDTITAANARKLCCKRGHPFTNENTRIEGTSRRCKTCRRDDARARYHRA